MTGQPNVIASRSPLLRFAGWLALTLGTALAFYAVDVKMTLAFLLAASLVVALMTRPDLTTLLVMFALYANLVVVAMHFSKVPEPVAVGFFLLLGIPFAHYVVLRRGPVLMDTTLWLMLAYLAVLLISAAFSSDPIESREKLTQYVAEGMILYFLVLNTIRTPGMLRKVAWILVLAGAFMGSISVYQRATGSYNRSFGGLAQVDGSVEGDEDDGGGGGHPRVAGPIGEKNRFAQIMVVLLPLAVILWRLASSRRARLAAAGSAALVLSGTLLTYSRGAAVALFLLTIALVMLRYIRATHVLAYVGAGLVLAVLVAPGYIGRLTTLTGVSDIEQGRRGPAESSLRGRAAENFAALHLFLTHPVLGVGPGQTRLYIAEYGNELGVKRLAGTRRGHNLYLEELADSGVAGFTLLMVIVGLTLRQLRQVRRRWLLLRPEYAELATGLLLSLAVYLATAMFLHLSYQRYFWLLMALSGVAIHLLRTAPLPECAQDSASSREPGQAL